MKKLKEYGFKTFDRWWDESYDELLYKNRFEKIVELLMEISKWDNNKINQTCLITNNTVPHEYRHAFDHVVEIPWKDEAKDSKWKIENRWKIINASPFKESLVYDTDMLLLSSNDHWWNFFKNTDVSLTANVIDYKGRIIQNNF